MNALFIGPYRQNDDQGLVAKSYIRAIATNIKNLTTRPIFLSHTSNPDISNDILSYENSMYDSYDIVIQQTLPHCLFYDGRFKKNIGLLTLETNNISHSECIPTINQMDEIWVSSEQERKCLTKSGIIKPIKVISQPIDIENIKIYSDHKLNFNSVVDRTFKFYFIGEYVERKNIQDLIVAFSIAFNGQQSVSLILKTSIAGLSNAESYKAIETDIEKIKKKLCISDKYNKEIIITEKLNNKDIIGLHNACDCFINPSLGEAFSRSAAEALCLGKTPIVTDNTGMIDFINSRNGFIIKSHRVPVIINNRPLSTDFDIYTANEYWYRPDIYDMVSKMQTVYALYKEDRKQLQEKRQLGIDSINNFSYETIGNKLCI